MEPPGLVGDRVGVDLGGRTTGVRVAPGIRVAVVRFEMAVGVVVEVDVLVAVAVLLLVGVAVTVDVSVTVGVGEQNRKPLFVKPSALVAA